MSPGSTSETYSSPAADVEASRRGRASLGIWRSWRTIGLLTLLASMGCASSGDRTESSIASTVSSVVAAPSPTSTVIVAPSPPVTATEATVGNMVDSETEPADLEVDGDSAAAEHRELRDELQTTFDEWFETSSAPGASLAVQLSDGAVLEFTGGVSNAQSGAPVTGDSVFRIASISKSMTAAVVVDLAEEGLIELDASVETYLGSGWVGDHRYASEITVRQLLGHTSGLREYLFTPGFGVEAQNRYGAPWTPEEILDFVGRQGAEFRPGQRFSYNTGGFIAAGLIIEEVTGQSAAVVLDERLFAPAGASSIGLPPEAELSADHVSGYVDGGLAQMMVAAEPEVDQGVTLANGTPVVDVLTADQAGLRSSGWTGGGVEATMASTAAVWHAIFDGSLLGETAIDELTSTRASASYGLGVMLDGGGTTVLRHTGTTAGFRSQAGYLPAVDASFAMSANTSAEGHRIDALATEVIDILAGTG